MNSLVAFSICTMLCSQYLYLVSKHFPSPQKVALYPLNSYSPFPPSWKLLLFGVQSLSCLTLFSTPWTAARQAPLAFTISRSLLKLMFNESVMPSNHLILCCPLLLLLSIFPSIRVFSSESALRIGWPKSWSFSFSISPSNEHWELISFRMDWLDLLAVQGTLQESSLSQRSWQPRISFLSLWRQISWMFPINGNHTICDHLRLVSFI